MLCCHWEVGHRAPQAELHVLVILVEPQGGVQHVGCGATSERSGLHCREKGENRECKNCWSMDELWGFLCVCLQC